MQITEFWLRRKSPPWGWVAARGRAGASRPGPSRHSRRLATLLLGELEECLVLRTVLKPHDQQAVLPSPSLVGLPRVSVLAGTCAVGEAGRARRDRLFYRVQRGVWIAGERRGLWVILDEDAKPLVAAQGEPDRYRATRLEHVDGERVVHGSVEALEGVEGRSRLGHPEVPRASVRTQDGYLGVTI